MNIATRNIQIQVFGQTGFSFILGKFLGVGLLGLLVNVYLIFWIGIYLLCVVLSASCVWNSKGAKGLYHRKDAETSSPEFQMITIVCILLLDRE